MNPKNIIIEPSPKPPSLHRACLVLILLSCVTSVSAQSDSWPVLPPTLDPNASGSIPASDPPPDMPVPEFAPEVLGQHPRLMFSAADVPRLQAFYASEEGRLWRDKIVDYLPSCVPPTANTFLTDGTDAQRQALWRLPTVALHHLLTGDSDSLAKARGYLERFMQLPDWDTTSERNSGMGGANMLAGVALAYDWLWSALEPSFREPLRQKIWLHARALYYGGYLRLNPPQHYWQPDPQNNHRWHRAAGLALGVLAAYTGDPAQDWLLARTHSELNFISTWLPDDGSQHESAQYLSFGGFHLVLAFDSSDRCLGTDHLGVPFFRETTAFRLAMLGNGFTGAPLDFGDWTGSTPGTYTAFLFRAAVRHQRADERAALRKLATVSADAFSFGWMGLVGDTDTLPAGDPDALPRFQHWPDLGVATVRTGWDANAVALRFKAGPLGGHLLNAFQHNSAEGYINVAHDDPDANSFVLAMGPRLVAETDRYSYRKASRNHNTILVNGIGQTDTNGVEIVQWTQPKNRSNDAGVDIVAAYQDGPLAVIEGEAASAYPVVTSVSRPALQRFRRVITWLENNYVLVYDDIRAPSSVNLTWLLHGRQLTAQPQLGPQAFLLSADTMTCPVQLYADAPLTTSIAASPADNRATVLGWQQLRAVTNGSHVHYVALLSPWPLNPSGFNVARYPDGRLSVTVRTENGNDEWTFAPPPAGDRTTPTGLAAARTAPDGTVVPLVGTPATNHVAAPMFSPGTGTYAGEVTVTLTTSTPGASIRYTSDGSTPSPTHGALYSGPLTITATSTLKAIAFASGLEDSAVTTAFYTIPLPAAATPTFSVSPGTYTTAQWVEVSTATPGASIRYTTNGLAPTETTGTLYTGPVRITSPITLRAVAYASDYSLSDVASATYTVNLPARISVADAYVQSGTSANTNFGLSQFTFNKLNLASDTRETFLRFDVSGWDGAGSAVLRLYPIAQGTDTSTIGFETVVDDSWSETGITWNTKPAGSGTIFATAVGGFTIGVPVEIDLTEAAKAEAAGDGVLSLRLSSRVAGANRLVQFASRESPTQQHRPAILFVAPRDATVTLGNLNQLYDGGPKPVTVTTAPAGLAVAITYDGATTAPTAPGTYAVVATITEAGYTGSATGALTITTTAAVRHAPIFSGRIEGSVHVMTGENVTLNSSAVITGDLLVPGLPAVQLQGSPIYGGTLDGTGDATPDEYQVTLNSGSTLRHVVRRTNPLSLPVVAAPPLPAGTRDVTLKNAKQSVGDFSTLRHLTLNKNVGFVTVPAGTYGNFSLNANSGFVLGVAGATTPAVYHLQNLTINSGAQIRVVGPVRLILANGVAWSGTVGDSANADRLVLEIACGGLTLNRGATFFGHTRAPSGAVTINGQLTGRVTCDQLIVNSDGVLR